ncbi:MAG TPA: nicotinate-nucleotide adenylyltransferase [Syntrophales bacterium]|nr:nicotinate-nucleotide adenylyltransferase [Syntrophales bacterium]HOL58722.1 nicotinate-nucleotide adenylyltransferase [Syntrophales bacterium]HPO34990.1 nicotinate-nucleotide adenylyltransferase [Syntrophales bacterium]
MRWGLFGGCFDPIHYGHLRSAEEVREKLGLEKVVFIPTRVPPHKDPAGLSAFPHRYEMVRRAIGNHPFFEVSDEEGKRDGVSYTVDTVDSWRRQWGEEKGLFFITGQDAFDAIRTWKEWERLIRICNFAVMTRPGSLRGDLACVLTPEVAAYFQYSEKDDCYRGPAGYGIYFVSVTFLDIKARSIRKMIRQGRSVTFLTPDPVIRYIKENKLYMEGEGA